MGRGAIRTFIQGVTSCFSLFLTYYRQFILFFVYKHKMLTLWATSPRFFIRWQWKVLTCTDVWERLSSVCVCLPAWNPKHENVLQFLLFHVTGIQNFVSCCFTPFLLWVSTSVSEEPPVSICKVELCFSYCSCFIVLGPRYICTT
jgi:hypothetical protein